MLVTSIVQAFNVTNKWVFSLFCNVLLSRDAQPYASTPRVLLEDGGRERRDEGDMRRARKHKDARPCCLQYGATGT